MQIPPVQNLLKATPAASSEEHRQPPKRNPRHKKEKIRPAATYAPDGRLSETSAAAPSLNITA
jgi:hypothetical protein